MHYLAKRFSGNDNVVLDSFSSSSAEAQLLQFEEEYYQLIELIEEKEIGMEDAISSIRTGLNRHEISRGQLHNIEATLGDFAKHFSALSDAFQKVQASLSLSH